MPQTPRSWFRKATGWWVAQVDHKQVKFARGSSARPDTERIHRDLLTLRDLNPPHESGVLTVAAVIELAHPAFQGPGVTKSAIRAPSNALPHFRTL